MNLQYTDPQHEQAVRLLEQGWPCVIHKSYTESSLDGAKRAITFGPFKTAEEADATWNDALRSGWTPPKWWQFWRWDDHPRRP